MKKVILLFFLMLSIFIFPKVTSADSCLIGTPDNAASAHVCNISKGPPELPLKHLVFEVGFSWESISAYVGPTLFIPIITGDIITTEDFVLADPFSAAPLWTLSPEAGPHNTTSEILHYDAGGGAEAIWVVTDETGFEIEPDGFGIDPGPVVSFDLFIGDPTEGAGDFYGGTPLTFLEDFFIEDFGDVIKPEHGFLSGGAHNHVAVAFDEHDEVPEPLTAGMALLLIPIMFASIRFR